MAAGGVKLIGEIGLGSVKTGADAAPMVAWARAHGMVSTFHTGGPSIPGSNAIGAAAVLEAKPDIAGHINGGTTSLSESDIDALVDSGGAIALELVHCGNGRTALYALARAREAGALDRVILGNDAPSGTGVVPLGILRLMAHLASLGDVAPESVGRVRDGQHGPGPPTRHRGHRTGQGRGPRDLRRARRVGRVDGARGAGEWRPAGRLDGAGRWRAAHRSKPEHAAGRSDGGDRPGRSGRRGRALMRFGLRLPSFALGPDTASLAEMGAYLRRAEDLGFESALLIDHLLVAPPAYRTTWLEPISLLSALSGVTRTIRLGTLVLVLPFRDPVAFAKEWATFDMLSGGRSILGVGVGWHPGEFSALRIPIKERGRRMNEMLEAITALWAGDDVSYEGQFYRFEGLTIDPKPAQRPHPPIWIGGGTQPSEKIYGQAVDTIRPVLRRIAKYASTWVPHSSATAEMVAGDWGVIREEMAGLRARPRRDDQGLFELHPRPRSGRVAG